MLGRDLRAATRQQDPGRGRLDGRVQRGRRHGGCRIHRRRQLRDWPAGERLGMARHGRERSRFRGAERPRRHHLGPVLRPGWRTCAETPSGTPGTVQCRAIGMRVFWRADKQPEHSLDQPSGCPTSGLGYTTAVATCDAVGRKAATPSLSGAVGRCGSNRGGREVMMRLDFDPLETDGTVQCSMRVPAARLAPYSPIIWLRSTAQPVAIERNYGNFPQTHRTDGWGSRADVDRV